MEETRRRSWMFVTLDVVQYLYKVRSDLDVDPAGARQERIPA